MIRYLTGAGAIALLGNEPSARRCPDRGDQLAQIRGQRSSEQLAQSNEAKQYQEARRLGNARKQMEAQNLTGQSPSGRRHLPAAAAVAPGPQCNPGAASEGSAVMA